MTSWATPACDAVTLGLCLSMYIYNLHAHTQIPVTCVCVSEWVRVSKHCIYLYKIFFAYIDIALEKSNRTLFEELTCLFKYECATQNVYLPYILNTKYKGLIRSTPLSYWANIYITAVIIIQRTYLDTRICIYVFFPISLMENLWNLLIQIMSVKSWPHGRYALVIGSSESRWLEAQPHPRRSPGGFWMGFLFNGGRLAVDGFFLTFRRKKTRGFVSSSNLAIDMVLMYILYMYMIICILVQ